MLPRSQRLRTSSFATAFQNGRILRHPLLQLRVYRRQDGRPELRAAFVAAKKLGKATQRNRLRRRISERYRLSLGRHHPGLSGCDLIFLATAAAITADTAQLDAAIAQLLSRAAGGGAQKDARRETSGTLRTSL
jgi:ribonuclease P protein component